VIHGRSIRKTDTKKGIRKEEKGVKSEIKTKQY
jgi:hypothetical protein